MLSTSERIKLVAEVSRRLSSEEWSIIDLILREFELPTYDTWTGSKPDYVIQMVHGASDQTLTDLAVHLGIDVNRGSAIEPTFWTKGYLRLFISHVARIKTHASALQLTLKSYGVSAFVAHLDIEPAKEWISEIETALATCDALVAFLTPDFHESKWTDQEVGWAIGRQRLVLSVRIEQDPYGFIGRFQALLGKDRTTDDLARDIFELLLNHKLTRERMREGLVTLFEEANTFKEAKERTALLERISDWQPPLANRIQEAVNRNGQIRDAFGVRERVQQLLKKVT